MTESTGGKRALEIVEVLTAALTGAGVAAPIVFGAVRAAIAAFRHTDPADLPTDAEVIDALRQKALINRDANSQWLRDHGFAD